MFKLGNIVEINGIEGVIIGFTEYNNKKLNIIAVDDSNKLLLAEDHDIIYIDNIHNKLNNLKNKLNNLVA